MGIDPGFIRLVRLAGRALYRDLPIGSAGRTGDVLDAIADFGHQWVKEDVLADAVKMKRKELNPILLFLKEEKLIQREVPPQTKRRKRKSTPAASSTEEREDKAHVDSHCWLDYSKVCDVVRCRIIALTEKPKSELHIQKTVQQYFCTDCGRSYSALDALQLTSTKDEFFHCERCDMNLIAVEDGENNGSKHKKALELLQKLENELRPLTSLLQKLKGVPIPEFITLQEWRERTTSENIDAVIVTPPSLPESIKVEACVDASVSHHDRLKALPPWLIKGDGINLTEEEREFLASKLNVNRQVGMKSKRDDCF